MAIAPIRREPPHATQERVASDHRLQRPQRDRCARIAVRPVARRVDVVPNVRFDRVRVGVTEVAGPVAPAGIGRLLDEAELRPGHARTGSGPEP